MLYQSQTAVHRLINDIQTVKYNDDFHQLCRGDNPSAFTRSRKLPLSDLFVAMACSRGITSSAEMHVFSKRSGTYSLSDISNRDEISGSGYLKARKNLNPDAILSLIERRLKSFYENGNFKTSDTGDLFLAIDGSKVMIYNTPYTYKNYKAIGRNKTAHNQMGIGISVVEDTLNGMSMIPLIKDTNFDEIKAAKEQLLEIRRIIGTIPFIVVMDRGYPSLLFFVFMTEHNIRFIIRLSSTDFKEEQANMKTDDEEVFVKFTKARLQKLKGTPEYDRLNEMGGITVRFIRVWLSSGFYEVLATNEFNTQKHPTVKFKTYYFYRWPVEVKYGFMKGTAKLENFSGYKDIMMRQDVYMSLYMSNILSDIINDLSSEVEKINQSGKYKHEMKIDHALAFGALKEDLADIWYEEDSEKRYSMIQKLFERIKNHLVPIRSDRTFERRKGTRAGTYSLTHRPTY